MFQSSPTPDFRPVGVDEARALRLLLTQDFRGTAQLRAQSLALSVTSLDANGSLRLSTQVSTPAMVDRRIPIEASYVDSDGVRVHVLLHVVDGYLDEFEVYREDSGAVNRLPGDRSSVDFEVY